MKSDSPKSNARLEALRKLLTEGKLSTQEELCEKLERLQFSVTQSTVSRDLRRLGAIKALDPNGRTVYRLDPELPLTPPTGSLRELILEIVTNGPLIVIRTRAGSASLLAVHLDRARPDGILGTLAGDDTIFVAPADPKNARRTIRAIEDSLEPEK